MTAPLLKDQLSDVFVQQLAQAVAAQVNESVTSQNVTARVFKPEQFIRAVLGSHFTEMPLKARIAHIAQQLKIHLDLPFKQSYPLLMPVSCQFTGLPGLVFPHWVELCGLSHFDDAMVALAHFTQYSTAEFAIRPYLAKYPEQTLAQLQTWANDGNEHLRRLASEGCRPRLPWGMALSQFKRDPTPILPILEQLKADPADYVRRSVANNLNDISKDHPAQVLQLAQSWYGHNAHTDWIVRHALRGLLKQGHPDALSLLQCHPRAVEAMLRLDQSNVILGESVCFSLSLQIQDGPAPLRLEYAIEFAGKQNKVRRKVFQWLNKVVGPAQLTLQKQYRFVDLTTRKHYKGAHRLEILVNGQAVAAAHFTVSEAIPQNLPAF